MINQKKYELAVNQNWQNIDGLDTKLRDMKYKRKLFLEGKSNFYEYEYEIL